MMMMGHRFFSRVTNNHTRSLIGTTIYVTSGNRKNSSKWQRWCVYYGMEQVFHPNIIFPNKRNVPLPVGMRSDGAIKYYTLLLLNAGKYGAMCREMLKKKNAGKKSKHPIVVGQSTPCMNCATKTFFCCIRSDSHTLSYKRICEWQWEDRQTK